MADVLEDAARPTQEGSATDILDMTQGGGPSDVEIYRKLRDAIETGRFEPGDRLPPERDLALRLGSSRNLVRRAVQRLERERRVIRHVGRGTFVAPADGRSEGSTAALSSNVSPLDVLEARMAIEPGFADLVVARASEDDFARLESRLKAMEDAPTQQEFREAGYAFHLELARTTRNPLLVRIFELIIEARAAAGWGRLRALNDTAEARAAQTAANRQILVTLRDRDSELARRLIRAHLGRMVASVAFQPER
jgi:DNA-binding FadR family transcriptional regulator